MKITNTSELTKIMCLIYGRSKVGKTRLAATAPKPLFIDVNENLISLQGMGIERTKVTTLKQFKTIHDTLLNDKKFRNRTIVFDSLSNLARLHFKKLKKKERKELKENPKFNKYWKYDCIYDDVIDVIDLLAELPQDVIVICKERSIEIDGEDKFRPLFPGKAIHQEIPYLFTLLFNMRLWEKEGKNGESKYIPFLQTFPNHE